MGVIGFGQDEVRAPSSLLADPSRLLRQTVENWVSTLEDSPAEGDFEGVSEALIIALECGGYPMTDLHQGHVEIAYAGHAGDQPAGEATLRKTIEVQRAIIRKQEDDLRKKGREINDLIRQRNRSQMLVKLNHCGVIE